MGELADKALGVFDGEVVEDSVDPSLVGRNQYDVKEEKSIRDLWGEVGCDPIQLAADFSFRSEVEFLAWMVQCRVRTYARAKFLEHLFTRVLQNGKHYGTFEGHGKTGKTYTSKPILMLSGAERICQTAGVDPITRPDYSDHWKDFWAKGYIVYVTSITTGGRCTQMWGIGHPEEDANANRAAQLAQKRSLVSCVKRHFALSEIFVMEPEEIMTNVWAQLSLAPTAPRDGRFKDGGQEYPQQPGYVTEPGVKPHGPTEGPPQPMPTRARPDLQKMFWQPRDGRSQTMASITMEIAKRRGLEWDKDYMFALVQEAGRFKATTGPRKGQTIAPPGDPNEIQNDNWRDRIISDLRKLAAKLRERGEDAMAGYTPEPTDPTSVISEYAKRDAKTTPGRRRKASKPPPPEPEPEDDDEYEYEYVDEEDSDDLLDEALETD